MKINWSFIEPVRDQAARLRGDFVAKSEIVKLAEQQAEIERLREENARLREALEEALPFVRIKGMWSEEIHDRIAAVIREGGEND